MQAYLRSKWLAAPIACCFSALWPTLHHFIVCVYAGEHVGAATTLSASAKLVEAGLNGAVGVTAAVAAYDLYPES